jgi:hypothetical protein
MAVDQANYIAAEAFGPVLAATDRAHGGDQRAVARLEATE